jgi:hypothetical protein
MEGNQTTNHRLKWNGSKTHSSKKREGRAKTPPSTRRTVGEVGPTTDPPSPASYKTARVKLRPPLCVSIIIHPNHSYSFFSLFLPTSPLQEAPRPRPYVLRRPTRTATRCWFRRRRRKGAATTGRSRATPLLPSVPLAA